MYTYSSAEPMPSLPSKRATVEEGFVTTTSARCWHSIALTVSALNCVLFVVLLIMFSNSYGRYAKAETMCNQRPSSTAQALHDAANIRHTAQFNASIFGSSIYRGPPSPDVEAAWEKLSTPGMLRISYEEMLRAGGSEASVKIPDEYGGGYRAILELPHQMHCLYTLWQHTWPSYFNSIELGAEDPSSIFRQHLDHCADVLRQSILCNADSAFITYNWVEHLSHATPNFNTIHECKNHTAIYKWQEENKVDLPDDALKKPLDATQLPTFP